MLDPKIMKRIAKNVSFGWYQKSNEHQSLPEVNPVIPPLGSEICPSSHVKWLHLPV